MSDTKESMPAQPKTVELEKPPAWAIALSEKVVQGFASVEARLETVEMNVEVLVDDKKTVNERLSRIEAWKENEVTSRLSANSARVKEESQVNLKQDAALSQVITRVDAVEKKVDELAKQNVVQTEMLTTLTDGASKLFANPLFRSIATAAGAALLTWLTSKGLR